MPRREHPDQQQVQLLTIGGAGHHLLHGLDVADRLAWRCRFHHPLQLALNLAQAAWLHLRRVAEWPEAADQIPHSWRHLRQGQIQHACHRFGRATLSHISNHADHTHGSGSMNPHPPLGGDDLSNSVAAVQIISHRKPH